MNTLIYWLLKSAVFLWSLLPLKLIRMLGILLVKVFYLLTPKKHRWALQSLASAFPGLPSSSHRSILQANYNSFGMLGVEMGAANHWSREKLLAHTHIEGLEHYQRAAAQGRGVVLLSAHQGNFLWGFRMLDLCGIKSATIFRPRKPAGFQRFFSEMLSSWGVEAIISKGGLRPMAATLKRGLSVLIAVDQNAPIESGIFIPFLGRPACSYPTAAFLHRLTGAPVIPYFCIRTNEGFTCRFLPEQPYPEDIESSSWLKRAAAMDQAVIEQMVKEHPGQWNWIHRRYKTTPDGKESFYR